MPLLWAALAWAALAWVARGVGFPFWVGLPSGLGTILGWVALSVGLPPGLFAKNIKRECQEGDLNLQAAAYQPYLLPLYHTAVLATSSFLALYK